MPADELRPGLYEQVVTARLRALLRDLDHHDLVPEVQDLDPAEAPAILARHLARIVQRSLEAQPRRGGLARQISLINQLLELLAHHQPDVAADLAAEGTALYAVHPVDPFGEAQPIARPLIPLSVTDLLVNGDREPSVGNQIERELASADRIDLLCAFINWYGVRLLRDALAAAVQRGAPLRVLTTTYMGVTQRRALDALADLGAQIRVAYENHRTRLHAKAWLLHRDTGYTTGYIGSSNLSRSALLDGLEWNVRVSQIDTPAVLDKFRATFEEYWASDQFTRYEAERFDTEIARARAARVSEAPVATPLPRRLLDVTPTRWQEEALYQLQVERERHNRWHNLVVAATGTGKTVLAALDYRGLRAQLGPPLRLLFVAHRKEILQQSLGTFRDVLGLPSFGELFVAGRHPDEWDHVFASIQSLTAHDPAAIPPAHFDVVIVDEFHHAAAATYRRLLDHLQPAVLLGLTATPERADLQDITIRFDGRIAVELRVWTAIEEGWLCPFQYFGVPDTVDLSGLEWRRGGYVAEQLDQLLTGNDIRLRRILDQVNNVVPDPNSMRALGFCVSVAHAQYMAARFTDAGLPAKAVTGTTPANERDKALEDLKTGQLRALFSVEVFNEGVDVPELDTILLLRPTESATVFLQQLGRGLRWSPHSGKAVCTVLDLIGQQHRNFRWDLRLRALTGARSRTGVQRAIEDDFPFLPPGCRIVLDRVAKEQVLEHVRTSLRVTAPALAAELQSLGDVDLATFLAEAGLEPEDLYRTNRSLTTLRRTAGLPLPAPGPGEDTLVRGLGRLLHLDDPDHITLLSRLLAADRPPPLASLPDPQRRLVTMLLVDLWGSPALDRGWPAVWQALWAEPAVRRELRELLVVLEERAGHVPVRLGPGYDLPLKVHCRYSTNSVLAALGVPGQRIKGFREGVYWDADAGIDVFFVTLRKSEAHYSPTTLYRDYAISPELFHWESQSTTSVDSPTGQRYLTGSSRVLLLAREQRKDDHGRTMPYLLLGPATYVSHERDRPIAITWRLRQPMPPDFFGSATVVAL